MAKMRKILTDNPGFSLLELMIVVAILAITAAIAIPNMIGWRGDAKLTGAVNNLKGDLNMAKAMAVRENGLVAILFSADGYEVFLDNGANPANWSREGDERLLRTRQLPAGIAIDLADTSLDNDRTRFNERGLPDPGNIGTIVVFDETGGKGQIQMNRLGRLTVQ